MLPTKYRLRKTTDIARVLKSKAGAFDSACGVKTTKNSLNVSRFAVVVGTKVSKSAVDRNRVRRQYREILRLMMAEVRPGFDVLLLTAKPSLLLDYQEKEKKLRSTLHRAKLL
ncbi:MAG: ribonuclease P protein component [Patescibacteria group bacterium]